MNKRSSSSRSAGGGAWSPAAESSAGRRGRRTGAGSRTPTRVTTISSSCGRTARTGTGSRETSARSRGRPTAGGSRVALVVGPTPLDCDHVAVWTPARQPLRRFDVPGSCGGVPSLYDVELAGSRVAWVLYGCGTTCDFLLKTVTLADPRPVSLAEDGFNGTGRLWDYHLHGDGDLLVFDDRLGLVRIGAGRQHCARPVPLRSRNICTVIRSGEHSAPADSVSGHLIAVRELDGVAVLDESGALVRFLPLTDVSAALLDGGRVVVARSSTLEVYDTATGARVLSRPLPEGRLVDVDGGIAVLIHADTIELLRLEDGRSTTLTPGRGPVFADLEPSGLYYSYADSTGGRVVFLPRLRLFR